MNGCCVDRDLSRGRWNRGCTDDTCMSLPEGETCGGCKFFAACTRLGVVSSELQTTCDFFPRHFQKETPK